MIAKADLNNTLIETLKKLNNTLDKFNNITDSKEEGGENAMNKLNELLEAYELTLEDLDFSTENLADDELTDLFNEKFGDAEEFKKKKKCSEEDPDDESDEDDDFACGKKKKKCDINDEEDSEEKPVEDCAKKKKRCSINAETGAVEFELSFDDIRQKLYGLLESDWNEDSYSWICEVYDSYFVYQKETFSDDSYNCKYYKQSYSKNGDAVELSGDATEVFSTFVTEAEKTALEMMRAQYDELVQFKKDTLAAQDQAKKDEIFENEKYAILAENEKFNQLKKDAANFSIDEIEEKCKVIFAEEVMSKGNYSASGVEKTPKKIGFNFSEKPAKKTAYGVLFDK